MKWYSKYNRMEGNGKLSCPNCEHIYLQEMAYFIYSRPCPVCKCETFFLSTSVGYLHPYIYVINLETCPGIIKNMFNYLSQKDNIESATELRALLDMISEKT